ncbi:MAG: M20 family metallopeptidase [Hyphomonadaceae bacterium]|nr:M20 family metallopeptidase [Hyphomonadaceae bacterium]
MFDPVEFTQDLVRFDTINPPGNEEACGLHVAAELEKQGLPVERQLFGDKRINVVMTLDGADSDEDPLLLTGHLDTVPLGELAWTHAPLGGEIIDGKLFGRGSSDMKSGVAAMMATAIKIGHTPKKDRKRGIKLVFTSGEEMGCDGAHHLIATGGPDLGQASAMIVGEPTENQYSNAHKGAMFMQAVLSGKTAHSSTPELGVNAIYKAARAISRIEDYGFNVSPHPQLGAPTINVGYMGGGLNANSVPDRAFFTIDIRTNAMKDHAAFFDDLKTYLGDDVELEITSQIPAVSTDLADPFIKATAKACAEVLGDEFNPDPVGLTFATDAGVLHPHYQCPTVILGPGEQSVMHQTDEFVYVHRIEQAVRIYTHIAKSWCLG